MASIINFDNHVKRLTDTMRGVQRILFVGTGIDISDYPTLAELKWKCIYTTNTSEQIADAFARSDRQVRPIARKAEYEAAATKLDQANPLLIYLNDGSLSDESELDPDIEAEQYQEHQYLCDTLTSLLKSELMVELVVVGYDLQNPKELQPQAFFRLLHNLSDNRVAFYGIDNQLENNKYFRRLVENGIVTLFEQNLGEALEKRRASLMIDVCDEEISLQYDENNEKNTVYIEGVPTILTSELCYDFNKYGRVLTVQEMQTGTINRMMQVDYFYQFLKCSPNAPQWYGYAPRNAFAVQRDFEIELYKAVDDSLTANSDTPVVLAGQTSSGKSIALAALAFRIFQERKYPVLFINNPEVNFAAGTPATTALDNLLKEIRDKGGQALVILDWSVYNLQRNDVIRRISDRYNNRGHKVLFVASAMNIEEKTNRYHIVKAPIALTEQEKKKFKDLVVRKGRLPDAKVEKWMEVNEGEIGLLSMLYRLVYELHPQLELGLKKEITKALADTKEGIFELDDPVPIHKPLGVIADQLVKLGLASLPEKMNESEAHEIKLAVANSLQSFSESLAVASLFKLRMPMTMAMHILQIPECSNRQQYRDVVFNAPWIHYAMDDDMYAPGEYYVSFRNPMDAFIYLRSINKTDADKMQIVANVIRSIQGKAESFYGEEVRFLERLIRMIGPNSDDPAVRDVWHSTYATGCIEIINALSELRENGIIEPQLVAQEITYIREYYGNNEQMDLEIRVQWLEKAIRIARSILEMVQHPNVDTAYWQQGLIDSITVESIFAELKLEKCCRKAVNDGERQLRRGIHFLQTYTQRSKILIDVIHAQPDNSYAYIHIASDWEKLLDGSLHNRKRTGISIPLLISSDYPYQRGCMYRYVLLIFYCYDAVIDSIKYWIFWCAS